MSNVIRGADGSFKLLPIEGHQRRHVITLNYGNVLHYREERDGFVVEVAWPRPLHDCPYYVEKRTFDGAVVYHLEERRNGEFSITNGKEIWVDSARLFTAPGAVQLVQSLTAGILGKLRDSPEIGQQTIFLYSRDGNLRWQIEHREYLADLSYQSVAPVNENTLRAVGQYGGFACIVDVQSGKILEIIAWKE